MALERLATNDGGPGQCFFADGIDAKYFEEYFNEPLIDGKFERLGPNESLDLFGYEEAARLMLKPDRASLNWSGGILPTWAKPISLKPEGGDQQTVAPMASESPKPVVNVAQRLSALNKR